MTTDVTPWQHVGDPAPPVDPALLAGFGWEHLNLPDDQRAMLRSLELAEKAEQREREERLAERMEQSHNRAVAESISRAHAAGEQWDPSNPWKHYPTHDQRVSEAFAVMDMQAAAELRVARAAAVKTLREHGVAAQITLDASEPRPHLPGGSLEPAAGEVGPTPEPLAGASSGTAQRARVPARGPGLPRHPVGEPGYNRLRIRRFFNRVGRRTTDQYDEVTP
jgi:hypothetical protein